MSPKLVNKKIEYSGRRFKIEKREFQKVGGLAHTVDIVNFAIPRSVAILPVNEKEQIVLEKHYRYAPMEEIFEIPAGWLEPGESPTKAARRELLEETGYLPDSLEKMGTILPAPGYSTEEIFLFLAHVKETNRKKTMLEKGELIRTQSFAKEQVLSMIKTDEIKDAMSICAVYRARLLALI